MQHAAVQIHRPSRIHEQLTAGFGVQLLGPAHDVMREFAARHPGVRLSARQLDDGELPDALREDRIDVALTTRTEDAWDLEVESICRVSMVVLMSEEHELADRASVAVDDLAEETFPGWHPELSPEWADLCWLRARRGRRPWRPRVTVQAPTSIHEAGSLVASGAAITVVPAWLAERYAGLGVLSVPLEDDDPLVVSVAYRAEDRDPLLRDFVDCAHRAAGTRRAMGAESLAVAG
jgi:DNA-binding transcriptional LysR family regulator